MSLGWHQLPGHCCGVLLLFLFLLLLLGLGSGSVDPSSGTLIWPRAESSTDRNSIRRKLPSLPFEFRKLRNISVKEPFQFHFERHRRKPRRLRLTMKDHLLDNNTTYLSYDNLPFYHGTNYSVPSMYEILHHKLKEDPKYGTGDPDPTERSRTAVSKSSGHPSNLEPPRNTRSAHNKFRHHHKIRFQLYSANAELLVTLLPNGTVTLTDKQNNPDTFFNIQPVLMHPYTTRFRSITTGIFMCMDRRGRLYSSCNYSLECEFLHKMEKTYYTTLESKAFPQRYITVSTDGRIRRSKKQKGKPLLQDHFLLELKISVLDTDRMFRAYYSHEPNAVLQHCAKYSPEFENEIRESSSFASSPKHAKHEPEAPRKSTKSKRKRRRKCKKNPKLCLGRKRKRCKTRRCALKRKRKRQRKLAQRREKERLAAALSKNSQSLKANSHVIPKNLDVTVQKSVASQANFRTSSVIRQHRLNATRTTTPSPSTTSRHRLHLVPSGSHPRKRPLPSGQLRGQRRRTRMRRPKKLSTSSSNDVLPTTTSPPAPPFRWTPSQPANAHKIRHVPNKFQRRRRKRLRGPKPKRRGYQSQASPHSPASKTSR